MDYTILALESSINDMKILREHLQDTMRSESEFILGCLETSMIVMEAGTNKPSIMDKITKNMKAFFEKIKALFRTKAMEQAKKHEEWIKTNRDNIIKLASKLTIEVLPYWEGNYNEHMRIIKSTVDSAVRNIEGKKFTHDYASKVISPKFVTDKNVIEYLKNFYRIGERDQLNLKQVKITGKDLASKVEGMLKYTMEYVGVAVPAVNQTSDHIIKAMDKVGQSLGKSTKTDTNYKVTSESYLFIEDCIIQESDLVSCINYTSVMEANNTPEPVKPEEKKKTEITDSDGDTTSATKVSVILDEENSEEKKEEKREKSQEEINFINEVTSFIKLLYSAFTTVMEERYITYINILRSIGNNKTVKLDDTNNGDESTNDEDNADSTEDEHKKKTPKQLRAELKAAQREEEQAKKLKKAQDKVDKLKTK